MTLPETLKNNKQYQLEYNFTNSEIKDNPMFVNKEISDALITHIIPAQITKTKEQEIHKLPGLNLVNKEDKMDLIYGLQLESVWEREDETHGFFDFSD